MLIRFSSKAGADVLMLEAHARGVLLALGRDPAPQGIFLPEQIGAALLELDAALLRQQEAAHADEGGSEDAPVEAGDAPAAVALRQRAWPVQELLQRAQAAGQFVQWQPL